MPYKDIDFVLNEYGSLKEYTGANAVVLAIRNIILTKKGNFPLSPSLGLDVENYQFEFLDKTTINQLRAELLTQINTYIPSIENVTVDVEIIEGNENYPDNAIGIMVSALNDSEKITASFLVTHDKEAVNVFSELLQ